MSQNDEQFSSKLGLVLAAIGSAVGLGTIWRFPSLTYENGGAAFLVIYIVAVIVLGIPLALVEFALGRGGKGGAITALQNLRPNTKWYLNGVLAVFCAYIILAYYAVISGWMLDYLFISAKGTLFDIPQGMSASMWFKQVSQNTVESPWASLIGTWLILLMTLAILVKGVKSIERATKILMPLFVLLLIGYCGITLSLPDAIEGVKFFLLPDFSKVSTGTFIAGLGQAFYSLSVGMGVMITYSSYFPKDTKLISTSLYVAFGNFIIAILMGLIVFPAVYAFGLQDKGVSGPNLVFFTLPEVFNKMSHPTLWSTCFFFLVVIAVLTTTISLAEVCVNTLNKKLGMSRYKALALVFSSLFVVSSLYALSNNVLADVKICGMDLLVATDTLTSNYLLLIEVLFSAILVGWVLDKKFLEHELNNYGSYRSSLFPIILFLIRYLAPVALVLIFISSFIH